MRKQKINQTHQLSVGLKTEDYKKIFDKFSKSTCRSLSEYGRKILLCKPITTYYRNQSLDDFMEETIVLRNELIAIGNNLNQFKTKLETLQHAPEFKEWIIGYELEKIILFNKVEVIKKNIQKIAEEQWLIPLVKTLEPQ
ncbi:plasmid mobilization protein [Flavobacterium sp. XS2P39]|uniref:plasmid mobilization protein n=1 Tax=Flavobacterium sp. XS2P39 TaxID=3401725 RepID=UPI003AAFBD84